MASQLPAPVVVVGMGGSGTRAVARALREAGVFMGTNTNGPKEDALEFAEFDYRWAPPFLAARREGQEPAGLDSMREEHEACAASHLSRCEDPRGGWGWKHCPSGHLLPFLAGEFPGIRVVHVLRDGRDMAFGASGGRTHTLRLGRAVLDGDPAPVVPGGDSWRGRAPTASGAPEATAERQAAFWAAVNAAIGDWGDQAGREHYLCVRLEDLVSEPEARVEGLLGFGGLAVPDSRLPDLAAPIQPPPTRGRWKQQPASALAPVLAEVGEQLSRFGYSD